MKTRCSLFFANPPTGGTGPATGAGPSAAAGELDAAALAVGVVPRRRSGADVPLPAGRGAAGVARPALQRRPVQGVGAAAHDGVARHLRRQQLPPSGRRHLLFRTGPSLFLFLVGTEIKSSVVCFSYFSLERRNVSSSSRSFSFTYEFFFHIEVEPLIGDRSRSFRVPGSFRWNATSDWLPCLPSANQDTVFLTLLLDPLVFLNL